MTTSRSRHTVEDERDEIRETFHIDHVERIHCLHLGKLRREVSTNILIRCCARCHPDGRSHNPGPRLARDPIDMTLRPTSRAVKAAGGHDPQDPDAPAGNVRALHLGPTAEMKVNPEGTDTVLCALETQVAALHRQLAGFSSRLHENQKTTEAPPGYQE